MLLDGIVMDTRVKPGPFGSMCPRERRSARRAHGLLRSSSPPAVTETRLPGISGLDLCRLLRHDAVTADIPVLFVTGL